MTQIKPLIFFFGFTALVLVNSEASLSLISFGESNLAQTIADNQTSGVARTVTLSGLESQKPYTLLVSLHISPLGLGMYNGDYYAYLRHISEDGTEQIAVLLNRIGRDPNNLSGYENNGIDITLSDSAEHDIHLAQQFLIGTNANSLSGNALTGSWQADARNVDPSFVTSGSARNSFLNPLGEMNPNGQWTLFVADMERGGEGKLVSWLVTLTPVPEPSSCTLLTIGLAALLLRRRRSRGSLARP